MDLVSNRNPYLFDRDCFCPTTSIFRASVENKAQTAENDGDTQKKFGTFKNADAAMEI